MQLPSGEQFVVPWGELVGLLVDRAWLLAPGNDGGKLTALASAARTTSMLPETHLVKKLAEVLTSESPKPPVQTEGS